MTATDSSGVLSHVLTGGSIDDPLLLMSVSEVIPAADKWMWRAVVEQCTFGFQLLLVIGCTSLLYSISIRLARHFFPNTHDIYFTADAIFGLVYYPALTAFAVDASSRLYQDLETRWFGTCTSARILGLLLCGRMIVHVPYLFWKRSTFFELCMMVLHHSFCIAVYGGGLIGNKCHFFGALNGMCEVTNIFLTNLELWMSCYPRPEKSYLYKINSAFLFTSFVLFRMILFPAMMCVWFSDVYYNYTATWAHPEMTWLERYLFPLTTVVMLALSIHWFIPLTKGTMKTFGLIKTNVGKKVRKAG